MESIKSREKYHPHEDFVRVAAATPEVAVGDVVTNAERIAALYEEASSRGVSLVAFPELSLTGYSIQDLVQRHDLLDSARHGLAWLATQTEGVNTAMIVGLPIAVGNAIYNTAAVLADGEIKGIVPKQNLPTYNEFYEKRWFQTWDDRLNVTVSIDDNPVPFGRDQLFEIAGSLVGIEICEDLWVTHAPHERLANNGALIIANPSASPETVSKAEYRRTLVGISAAKAALGYVYASADYSESTAETVMSGHAMINENGAMLAERPPLTRGSSRLTIADIDTWHLRHDRHKNNNYPNDFAITPTRTNISARQSDLLRTIDASPFIPKGSSEQITERLDTILDIQALGLTSRLMSMPRQKVVLGLSGGLDSTLALLVAMRTAEILGIDPGELVHTLTMPSHASSQRTQSNAASLSEAFGIPNEEISIADMTAVQLNALQHNGTQDITYENTQARLRQALVFNKANQIGALALGTGDLSEAAMGWCTYGGDQTSGYHVNASIPKTLVKSLVEHASKNMQPIPQAILHDILDTPVSPELTGDGSGISQETDDSIGPRELRDFFLYHFVRWAEPKRKIGFLALHAFEDRYDQLTIDKWLDIFVGGFYTSQWKRQTMPDGPKVGLSLGPRGDWRMPPDIREPLYRMLGRSGVMTA